MNTNDLVRLGVPVGGALKLAHEFIQNFIARGQDGALLEAEIFNIVANPPVSSPTSCARRWLARSIGRRSRHARNSRRGFSGVRARSRGREADGQ